MTDSEREDAKILAKWIDRAHEYERRIADLEAQLAEAAAMGELRRRAFSLAQRPRRKNRGRVSHGAEGGY